MKLLFLLSISVLSLFASLTTYELRYESGISFYGKVGYVDLKFEENLIEKTYKLHIVATSTGIVNTLTKNRRDIFTSQGIIEDGIYKPTKFVKHTIQNDKDKKTTYLFNYEKNEVTKDKVTSTQVTKSEFNIFSLEFETRDEIKVDKNSKSIDFYKNDFLSLYLNLAHNNLDKGNVSYIDIKAKDKLVLVSSNKFDIEKNHGDDRYSIVIKDDEKSIFFNEIVSLGVSFYGDAYIKKISEKVVKY